ncbi:MAG: ATP-binding cassette domain-containing protein [Treponema sp.]|jgi:ATP-binding cassette subfamily B protein/ATP-binding cassette subfamily C protein|nr:ATP-binding cassette domain-containing protein [Treponema sp.]
MKLSSFANIPKKLNLLLSRKQKLHLFILILFTLFLSVMETVGISAIMPFITVASNPAVLDEGVYKEVFNFLGFNSKTSFIVTFGFLLVGFYFFRMVYNVGYTYIINKFSLGTHRGFSLNLFKIFFKIPYRNFVQKNIGEIIYIISGETGRTSNLILNVMQVLSESFTVLMIYVLMIFVNWRMTLVLTGLLSIVAYLIVTILIRRTRRQGVKLTEASLKQSRIFRESFDNFKFIKLRGSEKDKIDKFQTSAKAVARASIISTTLGVLPRNILENIGFSMLICVVIFIFWKMDSPQSVIPIISMYAIALYRMLPALNRMLSAVNNIAYNQNSLDNVYNAVHQETENEGSSTISFDNYINIDSIFFRYNTGAEVLKNISFKINKGESIAVTGESGSGKSTLVDILIGIHKPNSGTLFIDDIPLTSENIRSWRNKIGYIPQNIYLFDGTVAENVAFSSELDEEKLINVLKMANIWDFLKKNNGIHTNVGEGGIQLSGGQKQRIGIARALYTNPEVLVLDEATSSLDNETEGRIMDEIYSVSKDKTLIVIAHRLTTVERCKRHIVIEDGKIRVQG